MTATIINGREIAKSLRTHQKTQLSSLEKQFHIKPRIATIKIGSDPSSELYLALRDHACQEVGIQSHHVELPPDTTQEEIIHQIQILNTDPTIHGILIQYPVPAHLSQHTLMQTVQPNKDVEGFHPRNLGNTLLGKETLVPCTPLAVLTILNHEQEQLEGADICIINHSNVVGKPLAALLLNRNATVTICHVYTKDLTQHTKQAQILITATGKPGLISKQHVKPGALIIDVGITPTKHGIKGDVNMDKVKNIAGKITPVPGGVGPVTIACSLQNMIQTYKNCVETL
jgi:methylenetetrahydrofolate dehydrogenase (NADP+)/methenyltetrahydrofolate cyclohydrolase